MTTLMNLIAVSSSATSGQSEGVLKGNSDLIAGAMIAVLILIYLVITLLKPEKF